MEVKLSEYISMRKLLSDAEFKEWCRLTTYSYMTIWKSAKDNKHPSTLISGAFAWEGPLDWPEICMRFSAVKFESTPMERVLEELNG